MPKVSVYGTKAPVSGSYPQALWAKVSVYGSGIWRWKAVKVTVCRMRKVIACGIESWPTSGRGAGLWDGIEQ